MLVEEERGAVQADRGLAGARASLHDEADVETGARMTTSCSAAIVATMSRISPVRARSSSARSGSGMPPGVPRQHAVGVVEHLVEDVDQVMARHDEPAAPVQLERVCAVAR